MLKKTGVLCGTMIIVCSVFVWAERRSVDLTSIMPRQDVLRVNKGVIGEDYRKRDKQNIPANTLMVEEQLNIGTSYDSKNFPIDVRVSTSSVAGIRIRNEDATSNAMLTAVNDEWDSIGIGKYGSSQGTDYGIESGDGYIFNQSGTFRIVQSTISALSISESGNVGVGSVNYWDADFTVAVDRPEAAEFRIGADYRTSGRDAILRKHTGDDSDSYSFDIIAGGHPDHGNAKTRFFRGYSHRSQQYPEEKFETMRIDTDGNVGIGTTDPEETLHVGGHVLVDDNIILKDYNQLVWDIGVGDRFPKIITTETVDYPDGIMHLGGSSSLTGAVTQAASPNVINLLAQDYVQVNSELRNSNLVVEDELSVGDALEVVDGRVNSMEVNATTEFNGNVTINPGRGDFIIDSIPIGRDGGEDLLWNEDTGKIVLPPRSTKRVKENIQPLKDDFLKILDMQVKTYDYIEEKGGRSDFGWIAEDLDNLGLENLVLYDDKGRPDDINRNGIKFYLLEVIKQQQDTNDSLEAEVKELRETVSSIENRLE